MQLTDEQRQNLEDLVYNTAVLLIDEEIDPQNTCHVRSELLDTIESNDDIYPAGPVTNFMIEEAIKQLRSKDLAEIMSEHE